MVLVRLSKSSFRISPAICAIPGGEPNDQKRINGQKKLSLKDLMTFSDGQTLSPLPMATEGASLEERLFLSNLSLADEFDVSMAFFNECVDMNHFLWEFQRDPTSRPITAAIFAVVYSLIVLVGVSGNICVLLSIGRTRSLQTVSNLFIFALSCSDIVVCCVSATFTPYTAFTKVWVFGVALCSLANFTAGTSLCFSIFVLAAISVDRFLLIRFPLNNQLRHNHALLIIPILCLFAMFVSFPMIFTQKLLRMEGYCGEFCVEDWGTNELYREIYGTILLIVQFFVPLLIITICYIGISVRLNRNILLRRKKMGNSWLRHRQSMADRRRQRTNRMFILMVCAFVLSWIWFILFNLLRDLGLLPYFIREQEFLYGIITHAIAMTSTIWNPILYALLNFQLRSAFLRLVPENARKFMAKRKFGQLGSKSKLTPKDAKLVAPTLLMASIGQQKQRQTTIALTATSPLVVPT
ncbi:hypothetical protein niasHS_014973 [Heterodera schachtii]|uniref:G-protein coupled receptors family 1 profile domain-containing protein n=1 Tax=Heterodera schachtii TaxID=97005 RepID=A0ABD2I432_HETSC